PVAALRRDGRRGVVACALDGHGLGVPAGAALRRDDGSARSLGGYGRVPAGDLGRDGHTGALSASRGGEGARWWHRYALDHAARRGWLLGGLVADHGRDVSALGVLFGPASPGLGGEGQTAFVLLGVLVLGVLRRGALVL